MLAVWLDAWMDSALLILGKGNSALQRGVVKPLRYEETSPTALAQIVSTPLRALCELCLRSDLRTLAPSDLIEGSREGLEKKTQFKNKTLSKRGI